MPSQELLKSFEAYEREQDLQKAQDSLWYLLTEVLDYDRFTEEFHKPEIDRIDEDRKKGVRRVLDLWPRGHYKTTVEIEAQATGIIRPTGEEGVKYKVGEVIGTIE